MVNIELMTQHANQNRMARTVWRGDVGVGTGPWNEHGVGMTRCAISRRSRATTTWYTNVGIALAVQSANGGYDHHVLPMTPKPTVYRTHLCHPWQSHNHADAGMVHERFGVGMLVLAPGHGTDMALG